MTLAALLALDILQTGFFMQTGSEKEKELRGTPKFIQKIKSLLNIFKRCSLPEDRRGVPESTAGDASC